MSDIDTNQYSNMCKVDVSKEKYALLSFDVEEFDVPSEYGYNITLDEQVALSEYGVNIILDLLKEKNIKSTFFCTTNFAIQRTTY